MPHDDLRNTTSMFIGPPRKAVELFFRYPWLFNTIIIFDRTIQDCNQHREAFLVLTQGVSLGFLQQVSFAVVSS